MAFICEKDSDRRGHLRTDPTDLPELLTAGTSDGIETEEGLTSFAKAATARSRA
jgi:hypothetical protein